MQTTRREFIGASALAAGGIATAGLAAEAKRYPLYRGALLHLGANMWGDYPAGPDDFAKSPEEEKTRPNPLGPAGSRTPYHSYLQCRDDLWKKSVDRLAEKKMNFVFIDLGEGIAYPSHPELAVAGTWSVEKTRAELARIRSLGIEPMPKLNFSTCHDSWLKDYHRMVSTPAYYKVVADVIADVCAIFDKPALFHLGFDEEVPVAGKNNFHSTFRQGDLWWHDLLYTVRQVERNGSRAAMWSDKICDGRDEFLKRMTKNVIMSPWYYWPNIAERAKKWDPELEKKSGTWDVQGNLPASFAVLSDEGFDLLACGSNVYRDDATEAFVKFCKERLDPAHLLGMYTAPWFRMVPDGKKPGISKVLAAVDQLADALARH